MGPQGQGDLNQQKATWDNSSGSPGVDYKKVVAGIVPGYKGHVPRHRDNVGVSPYRGRGADSKNLIGRVPSKSAIKPPSRPQSARGARKGEVVVL